uniref:Uncharacterized protein n=1 Tax=Desulfacinum infernum TaxID=35837 RepID=A0A832A647_9BACT
MSHRRELKQLPVEIFHNQKGMAMVLAVSTVALLSLLGLWLVVQSGSTYRVTQSVERRQGTFNLAEGAQQLSLYCLKTLSNEVILTNYRKKSDVTPSEAMVPYMKPQQPVNDQTQTTKTLTPRIIFLDSNRVPGWDMNKFRGYYYLASGEGVESLPAQKGGAARSETDLLVRKISQVTSR